jgi:acetyl/propionyl-CoA carboxylase alpha subunit
MIRKVFIPNRGEIVVRIIKAAHVLGIKTVVALWRDEQSSLAVQMTDEVFWWETPLLAESYLNPQRIVDAALMVGADAVHPGYGFLSENHLLAQACEQNGLVFVGPRTEHMKQMGDKTKARELAKNAGIPVVEGWDGDELVRLADKLRLPYPLLIKAAMGGGGKAMHVVETPDELDGKLIQAKGEALRYFGDSRVFVERYVASPRHIEVQLLADKYGNTIHLGERECSIQRRHQKIVEEAPAANLPDEARQAICADAVLLAKSIGYVNAGTIEFLVDANHNHYFLEMNTRIQVEHPVTEAITGIDLVVEQFRIANGEALAIAQNDVRFKGHAIETRIYAEEPANNFSPSPGQLTLLEWPVSDGVRIDTALSGPCTVLPDFDPMLAKVVTHGVDRRQAIDKQLDALRGCVLMGVSTNLAYLMEVLNHATFRNGVATTHFCDRHHLELISPLAQTALVEAFAAIVLWKHFKTAELLGVRPEDALEQSLGKSSVLFNHSEHSVVLRRLQGNWHVLVGDEKVVVDQVTVSNDGISLSVGKQSFAFRIVLDKNRICLFSDGRAFDFIDLSLLPSYAPIGNRIKEQGNSLKSSIPGRIVKVNVEVGQLVAKGDTLLVLEAMKMENHMKAWKDATIESLHVEAGHAVAANQLLMVLD